VVYCARWCCVELRGCGVQLLLGSNRLGGDGVREVVRALEEKETLRNALQKLNLDDNLLDRVSAPSMVKHDIDASETCHRCQTIPSTLTHDTVWRADTLELLWLNRQRVRQSEGLYCTHARMPHHRRVCHITSGHTSQPDSSFALERSQTPQGTV
jgi:hypothetical protein